MAKSPFSKTRKATSEGNRLIYLCTASLTRRLPVPQPEQPLL